ncbi:hypothetical protein B0T26DRAFT_676026 [Lasiosphaeria miniovina]|uniref:Uncharacterized protein n=1 Tax=Lasiosphaeria miniovina TaxID=1954250 RepID=A0AA40AKY9_9PEZI|nr:uncharacterized protein B0T26DRAFT_676026 [Lasiosphaeria miniovina]KAK0717760.1 hypothetical protein B0T26DRAFT_676026 [Lasiosphaeria miniovina]
MKVLKRRKGRGPLLIYMIEVDQKKCYLPPHTSCRSRLAALSRSPLAFTVTLDVGAFQAATKAVNNLVKIIDAVKIHLDKLKLDENPLATEAYEAALLDANDFFRTATYYVNVPLAECNSWAQHQGNLHDNRKALRDKIMGLVGGNGPTPSKFKKVINEASDYVFNTTRTTPNTAILSNVKGKLNELHTILDLLTQTRRRSEMNIAKGLEDGKTMAQELIKVLEKEKPSPDDRINFEAAEQMFKRKVEDNTLSWKKVLNGNNAHPTKIHAKKVKIDTLKNVSHENISLLGMMEMVCRMMAQSHNDLTVVFICGGTKPGDPFAISSSKDVHPWSQSLNNMVERLRNKERLDHAPQKTFPNGAKFSVSASEDFSKDAARLEALKNEAEFKEMNPAQQKKAIEGMRRGHITGWRRVQTTNGYFSHPTEKGVSLGCPDLKVVARCPRCMYVADFDTTEDGHRIESEKL